MKRLGNILLGAVIAAAILASFVLGRKTAVSAPLNVKVDTLLVRDTITAYKARFLTKTVVDSVYISTVDTLRDTVVVILPVEQVRWEDSLSVVWASGVRVSVDSVRHYTDTRVIRETVTQIQREKPRWGVGVTAGYGAGRDGLSPFVGVGITYNLLSW